MGVLDDIRKGTGREVSRKEDAPANVQQATTASAPSQTPAAPTPPTPQPQATAPAPNQGGGATAIKRIQQLAPTPELPQVQLTQADKEKVTRPTSYVEILRHLTPFTPPTAEEVEKDRRRQRSREAIAAIGDGVRAISNLVATANYAPNAYKPTETMLGSVQDRYEKLRAAKKADADAYLQAYMRAKQLDDHNDQARDALQLRRDQAALDHQLAQAKQSQEYQKWVAQLGEKEADRKLRLQLGMAGIQQRANALEETKRHHRASEAEQSRRTGIMATRGANSASGRRGAKESLSFDLGYGEDGGDVGGYEVPKGDLNNANIGQIYNQLPESVRAQHRTKKGFGPKATYTEPNAKEMLKIIGQNINDPNVQRAISRLPNARRIAPKATPAPAPAKPAPAPAPAKPAQQKQAPKGEAYKGSGSKGKAY